MTSVLLIGTPCTGGTVTNLYTQSVLNFQKACLDRQDVRFDSLAQWGDPLITRARQGLVTQCLCHPTATHLLFIDADVGFKPEQVFRLLKFDADIVAAAVPRNPREADRSPEPSLYFNYVSVNSAPAGRNGFVKALTAGTGLMLIKRSALEDMVEKYRSLRYKSEFASDPADSRYWSYALFNCLIETDKGLLNEDESFCRRWTDMGGEIWVDLESALKGEGPVVYDPMTL